MSINVTVTETPNVDLSIISTTGLNVGVGGISHNGLLSIQGGATDEYYHLSLNQYNKVVNQGLSQRVDFALPSGIEETGIAFGTAFSSAPMVQCELQIPNGIERTYFTAVRDISPTGFFVEFSDNIGTGYVLQTRAIPNT
tara:strand:- start:2562 stop:2981 length:420 start_codon:yes stop_codon:yes gene_type:complete